ncbi:histone H1-like [Cherax quadricarinatus]|nr:histone H1-like [Cherax quadricarinatus]XP_053637777.1 histone H1-like [Cherax quadricarinatus]
MATVPRICQALKLEAPLFRISLQKFCSDASKPPKATKASKVPQSVETPKAATPKAATPKAATPKAAAPKAAIPKASAAESVIPKAPDIHEYKSAATPSDPGHSVGPGALKSGDYPNTEYFCYEKMSFYDLEVEMAPHRLPQPSANNGRL